VFALTLLVASIALADSLNPSTELPALYLATTPHAVRKIAGFALGVFLVSFTFGVVVVVGPGQLLLGAVQHVGSTAKHAVEAIVGVVLILTAIALWKGGERLTDKIPAGSSMRGRSALALGAAIMVVELPTALPYFAALAAIVGSDVNLTEQILMVLVFNVVFLLPVFVILVLRMLAGARAEQRIHTIGEWTRRYAATAVASLAALAGLAFLVVGLAGLI
jgi:cytochrome c biogenesis protein CcdA